MIGYIDHISPQNTTIKYDKFKSKLTTTTHIQNLLLYLKNKGWAVSSAVLVKQIENYEVLLLDFKVDFKELITVRKTYYKKYKAIYLDFQKHGLIADITYTRFRLCPPETYLSKFYFSATAGRSYYKYQYLTSYDIIPKHKFIRTTIHQPITVSTYIQNTKIKGSFIDCCIRYIIQCNNNNITHIPLEYISACSSYNKFPDGIKNITDNNILINKLISEDFIDTIKNKFIKRYSNVSSGKLTYNHEIKTFGIPDIVADNTVIDIKTYKNNAVTSQNYIQTLLYAMILKINNICLYDPLKGYLYTMHISSKYLNKFYKYVKHTTHNSAALGHLNNKHILAI